VLMKLPPAEVAQKDCDRVIIFQNFFQKNDLACSKVLTRFLGLQIAR